MSLQIVGSITSVADPGFPVGGGRQLLTRLRFVKFVCQNERIGGIFRRSDTVNAHTSYFGPWIRPKKPYSRHTFPVHNQHLHAQKITGWRVSVV